MVEFVVVMMVVSPPRPLQVAADVPHEADVGPHSVQSVHFVLRVEKPRWAAQVAASATSTPQVCAQRTRAALSDMPRGGRVNHRRDGQEMWTCHKSVLCDGQTDQLRKDHGTTEQDPKNETTQKGGSVIEWDGAGQMRHDW